MLVVTRGIGESVMIGDNIVVSVERVTGGVVRIGVEAPKDAVILRSEMIGRAPVLTENSQRSGEEQP
jgi:carbon storage regulator